MAEVPALARLLLHLEEEAGLEILVVREVLVQTVRVMINILEGMGGMQAVGFYLLRAAAAAAQLLIMQMETMGLMKMVEREPGMEEMLTKMEMPLEEEEEEKVLLEQ
jgi:hypothetical protein